MPALGLASLCLVSGCTGDLTKRVAFLEINTGDLRQQLVKQQEALGALKKSVDSVAYQLSSLSYSLNNHKSALDSTNGKVEAMKSEIDNARLITDRLEIKYLGEMPHVEVKPIQDVQSTSYQSYSYGVENSTNDVEPLNDSKYDPYHLDADGE